MTFKTLTNEYIGPALVGLFILALICAVFIAGRGDMKETVAMIAALERCGCELPGK